MNQDINNIYARLAFAEKGGYFRSKEIEGPIGILNYDLDFTLKNPEMGGQTSLLKKIAEHQQKLLEKHIKGPILKDDIAKVCTLLGTTLTHKIQLGENYLVLKPFDITVELDTFDLRKEPIKCVNIQQTYEAAGRLAQYIGDNKEGLQLAYTLVPKD